MALSSLPIISLGPFLKDPNSSESLAESAKAAKAIRDFGALVVQDPRIPGNVNENFLDLFERYFQQGREILEKDSRPELHYQVGMLSFLFIGRVYVCLK